MTEVFYFTSACCEGGPENRHLPVSDDLSSFLRAEPAMAKLAINNGTVLARHVQFDIAVHEVSHAAAALSVGAPVEKVSRTRAYYSRERLPAADAVFTWLAGPIGQEMIASGSTCRRPDGAWRMFIDRVRAGRAGQCDGCQACHCVLAERPDASDIDVIEGLRSAESRCHSFFDDVGLRSRIRRAARALVDIGELPAAQIVGFLFASAADFQRDGMHELLEIETAPGKLRASSGGDALQKVNLPSGAVKGIGAKVGDRRTIFRGERWNLSD